MLSLFQMLARPHVKSSLKYIVPILSITVNRLLRSIVRIVRINDKTERATIILQTSDVFASEANLDSYLLSQYFFAQDIYF